MSDPQPAEPGAAAEQFAAFAEQSQRLIQAFWQRQGEAADEDGFSIADPTAIGRAFLALGSQLMADPARLAELQAKLWGDWALWETAARRAAGEPAAPAVAPDPGDRRFKDRPGARTPSSTSSNRPTS